MTQTMQREGPLAGAQDLDATRQDIRRNISAIERQAERGRWAAAARQMLGQGTPQHRGYVPGPGGMVALNEWTRVSPEQLPVGLNALPQVKVARNAALAERAAWEAWHKADGAARAWVQRFRPADGQPRPELKADIVEASKTLADAALSAERELAELGRVVAEVQAARQEVASIPALQRADDASHAMRRQARETRLRELQAQLAELRVLA